MDEGNEQRGLTPKEKERVEENLDLVEILATRLAYKLRKYLGRDDLRQIGSEAICNCAPTFDEKVGCKFRTYAKHRIAGAMFNAYAALAADEERVIALAHEAAHNVLAMRVRQGNVMTDMDGQAEQRLLTHAGLVPASMFASLAGVLKPGTPELLVSMREQRRRSQKGILHIRARLSERDARLLTMHYEEGLSLEEIGRVLRIKHPGVHRQHTRILERFRRILDTMGVDELPPREDEL